jgi:hypothetical protein
MISAAGIKDQELTIIVSMMLIELALLRLSRAAFFKHLALLDRQRLELLVALHPRVWWARRAGRLASVRTASSKAPSASGSQLEAEDAEKAGLGIKHPILQVAVYDGVETR